MYPLLLHGVDDEVKCRHIIDVAVNRVFRTLYDTGVLKGDFPESFQQGDVDVYANDSEKVGGNYDIIFPIGYPMPEKLFSEFQKWAVFDENSNAIPYMKHLYNVEVSLHDEGVYGEQEMLDAVSNFELWKDKAIDRSELYPSNRDQLTINGLCECLLYELIGAWKSWAIEQHARYCFDNDLPMFENTSSETRLLANESKADIPKLISQVVSDSVTLETGDDGVVDLDALRASLPPVPTGTQSKDGWYHVSEFVEMIGKTCENKMKVMANDREIKNGGYKTKDGLFGIDKNGYIWGKAGQNTQTFYRDSSEKPPLKTTTEKYKPPFSK
jgi:hypothetical protein